MINAINRPEANGPALPQKAAVPLSERVQAAAQDENGGDRGALLEEVVRQFAAQQFTQFLLFGEPEETGVVRYSFDGG